MILLTVRDIVHRSVRFVVVALLGACVFALLFVATGLVEQFNREPFDTVEAFGADTWILPEGVAGPFTAASTLSASTAEAVEGGSPVVIARSTLVEEGSAEEVVLAGHVPGSLGTPPLSNGRGIQARGEALVDERADIGVGTEVLVAGAPFDIVGVTSDTTVLAGIPLVFVDLVDAQELIFQSTDVVSAVLSPSQADAPSGTVAVAAEEIGEDTLGPLESAIATIDLVRVLLWAIAAVIIGAVVYLSALERQRDFAVLKAVGVPNRTLLASLALQAVLIALAAIALAAVIQLFLAPLFPLKVRVPDRAFWQLPLLACVIALLAALAGMRQVAKSDPALAFAGAGG